MIGRRGSQIEEPFRAYSGPARERAPPGTDEGGLETPRTVAGHPAPDMALGQRRRR
jgi:hypothetical protein